MEPSQHAELAELKARLVRSYRAAQEVEAPSRPPRSSGRERRAVRQNNETPAHAAAHGSTVPVAAAAGGEGNAQVPSPALLARRAPTVARPSEIAHELAELDAVLEHASLADYAPALRTAIRREMLHSGEALATALLDAEGLSRDVGMRQFEAARLVREYRRSLCEDCQLQPRTHSLTPTSATHWCGACAAAQHPEAVRALREPARAVDVRPAAPPPSAYVMRDGTVVRSAREFLGALRLGRYAQLLLEEGGMSLHDLQEASDADLLAAGIALGQHSAMHRRRFLDEARALEPHDDEPQDELAQRVPRKPQPQPEPETEPGGGAEHRIDAAGLINLIRQHEWSTVLSALDETPAVASAASGSRHQPLHLAILHKAPVDVVLTLARAAPQACHARDGEGRLPLHCALLCGSPAPLVEGLISLWPESCLEKDRSGISPPEIARAQFHGRRDGELVVQAVRKVVDARRAEVEEGLQVEPELVSTMQAAWEKRQKQKRQKASKRRHK